MDKINEFQVERKVSDTFTIFTPVQVTDEETGEVITYKTKQVISRGEIENGLATAQKELDKWQAKLDAINNS